jgi:hypothetical protein
MSSGDAQRHGSCWWDGLRWGCYSSVGLRHSQRSSKNHWRGDTKTFIVGPETKNAPVTLSLLSTLSPHRLSRPRGVFPRSFTSTMREVAEHSLEGNLLLRKLTDEVSSSPSPRQVFGINSIERDLRSLSSRMQCRLVWQKVTNVSEEPVASSRGLPWRQKHVPPGQTSWPRWFIFRSWPYRLWHHVRLLLTFRRNLQAPSSDVRRMWQLRGEHVCFSLQISAGMKSFVVLLSLSMQKLVLYFKLGHDDCFHTLSNSLLINHLTTHRYLPWDTDNNVNKLQINKYMNDSDALLHLKMEAVGFSETVFSFHLFTFRSRKLFCTLYLRFLSVLSSGIQRRLVQWKSTDVSEEHTPPSSGSSMPSKKPVLLPLWKHILW